MKRVLEVEGVRPNVDMVWLQTVKEDIRRVFNDRQNIGFLQGMSQTDVEFMLSMGLLVKEVSDRMKVLRDCLIYAYIHGGPRVSRNRELARTAMKELRGAR